MKIHKKAFPQSCRYGEYISFATLYTPITVLGAEQLAFPYKFILAELQQKYLTSFKQIGSLIKNPQNKNISFVVSAT